MVFLRNIEQIRGIQWGQKHLWDVRIQGVPTPFDTWFPAVDISIPTATIESHMVDTPMSRARFAKSTSDHEISLSFYDDDKGTLYDFFDNWINVEILNNGDYISLLSEYAKQVDVQKLSIDRKPIKRMSYFVYPEGTLTFMGDSSSEGNLYSVTLVIVGRL